MRAPEIGERELEPVGPMTWQEFLAFEELATIKHEFVRGYAYPHGDWATDLAGASTRHNRIASNLQGELYALAKASPLSCDVFGSDERLYVADLERGYYADALLVCEARVDPQFVDRPCLVIEVTSRGTARNDREEKLDAYRRLESLRAYWIVAPDERRVTRWWRGIDGWSEQIITEGEISVPSVDGTLALAAIYARSGV